MRRRSSDVVYISRTYIGLASIDCNAKGKSDKNHSAESAVDCKMVSEKMNWGSSIMYWRSGTL